MRGVDLASQFADAMGSLLGPEFPAEIGLAVSGGGDSMAMLTLAHNWTHAFGVRLWVVTVDHGLRPESAGEAALVARECAALGHSHATVRWQGWDGRGNLQQAARAARLRLIDGWRGRVRHVLMAHTADDQAETFLMRLARGSGVDGLAAMAPARFVPGGAGPGAPRGEGFPPEAAVADDGYWLLRPLLDARRDDLRHYLTVLKGQWIEDPSNLDRRFDRVKMRQALAQLAPLGLDVATLAGTAARMARARLALWQRAVEAGARVARPHWGDLLFERDALAALDAETRLRLLAAGVQYVAAQPYRPRASALEDAAERVLSGGTATLQGCLLRAEKADLRVCREHAALAGVEAPVGTLWDGRVRITGAAVQGFTVRALGPAGAAQLPARPEGLPYQSLIAQPAVFDGAALVAFGPAGVGPGHEIDWTAGQGSFTAFLGMH
ncbi:MAG: tRNA lysidine(34) synthetase TilS [Rhodobacteraceae bacterium]|nr:MAG: tRNA lysidine(34) synthetase TilS [Paracoccaceae bacterium]